MSTDYEVCLTDIASIEIELVQLERQLEKSTKNQPSNCTISNEEERELLSTIKNKAVGCRVLFDRYKGAMSPRGIAFSGFTASITNLAPIIKEATVALRILNMK
jgi:hypothetical protein